MPYLQGVPEFCYLASVKDGIYCQSNKWSGQCQALVAAEKNCYNYSIVKKGAGL